MEQEGRDYGVMALCRQAAAWLHEQAPVPARVRVVGDDDCDGASSAYIVASALRRLGYEVETRLAPLHTAQQAKEAVAGPHDLAVVADAGSTFLKELDAQKKPVLVLDHHTVNAYRPKHVFEVNPRR